MRVLARAIALALIVCACACFTYARAHASTPYTVRIVRCGTIPEDAAGHLILTRYNVGSAGVLHLTYRCARTGY